MKITKAVFVVLTAQRTGLSVYKTEKVLDAIIDKIKNIVGQGTRMKNVKTHTLRMRLIDRTRPHLFLDCRGVSICAAYKPPNPSRSLPQGQVRLK